MKVVVWFSCGAASALVGKWACHFHKNDDLVIARCVIPNEHEDNTRFAVDCEKWFGRPILNLTSKEYVDCWQVWEERRFIAGIKGAPCTTEMKKAVRWDFEREWKPDLQLFGFTAEEKHRAERFRTQNPDVRLVVPLIDEQISKADCYRLIEAAGLKLPAMYGLGFKNNNCIACGKATSIEYWRKIRLYFPAHFNRMAKLSRALGARLTRIKGERVFLDEIPPDLKESEDNETIECGVLCVGDVA